MSGSAKETVIILHGTWASPETGKEQWYYAGDRVHTEGFVAKLNAALQKRGSMARCWAHIREGGKQPFHWSGENSWVARTRAADALGDYVAKLRQEGWRCHIVAHSHGGNVMVEALPKIGAPLEHSVPLGRLVTLGTPFMDVITPALDKDERRQNTLLGISLMLVTYIVTAVFQNSLVFPIFWILQAQGWITQPDTIRAPVTIRLAVLAGSVFSSALLLVALVFRLRRLRLGRVKLQTYLKTNWRFMAFGVVLWLFNSILFHFTTSLPLLPLRLFVSEIVFALGIILVLIFAYGKRGRTDRDKLDQGPLRASNIAEAVQTDLRLLVIGSRMDEAWQVLHHLRNADNPVAVKSNPLPYLVSAFQSSFAQRTAVDRLYYGSFRDVGYAATLQAVVAYSLLMFLVYLNQPLFSHEFSVIGLVGLLIGLLTLGLPIVLLLGNKFFAAVLLPVRWCSRIVGSLVGVVVAIGTYVVRGASWPVFLKMAMGLEGYRFKIPMIEQCPSNIDAKLVKYENMPASAERLALKNRSAWIERHIEDVSQTFSKLVITAVDISLLLAEIEADQTLVHAAYYTDDQCIAQIAHWLAAEDDPHALAQVDGR